MQPKLLIGSVLLAYAACAAAEPDSQAPAPPVPLELSWRVSLDASGRVANLASVDARGEKRPQIRTALEQQIRTWQFTPGAVGGTPAPTETTLHLSLAVTLEGADRLHIRIEDAHTGSRVAKYAIPHYPRSAVNSGSGGLVITHAHFDANGKVTEVSLDEATPKTTHEVQKAALDAVKHWLFEPERVAGHGVAGDAYAPICFQVVRLAAAMPPPAPSAGCTWTPPGQHSAIAQGETLAMHPAATLLTDVIGRTL